MATFRLRRPNGGSALRGGDGLRAPDRNVYEYAATGGIVLSGAAAVSAIKVYRGDGGLDLGGSADLAISKSYAAAGGAVFGGAGQTEYVDGRGYVASGGLALGGAADTDFVSTAEPADHGGGSYVPRRQGLPIRRRQYGDPVTFEYLASGGIRHGGRAETSQVRHSAVHEAPDAAGGLSLGGAAGTEIHRPEDELLLLLAA